MRSLPRRHSRNLALRIAVPLLAIGLAATGCSGDDDEDPAAEQSPTRDENGLSLVDCTSLPEEDAAGPYEADEVEWVQEAADELEELTEADEVRYCVDPSGAPQYWLVFAEELDEAGAADTCAVAGSFLDASTGAAHLAHGDATTDC